MSKWRFEPEDDYAGPTVMPWLWMAAAAMVYIVVGWWVLG
jgi:hypothetical protein